MDDQAKVVWSKSFRTVVVERELKEWIPSGMN